MRIIFSTLMFFAAMLVTVAEGQASAIAVWEIESETGLKAAELEKLSQLIGAELTASGKYKVIPKDAVKQAIEKLQAKYLSEEMYDEETVMAQLGKSVAAQKHLKTIVQKIGEGCIVTMTLYDATTKLGEKAVTEKGGCGIDELVDLLSGAVGRLTGRKTKLSLAKKGDWRPATSGKRTIVRFRATPAHALVFLDEKLVCQGTNNCDLELFVGLHTVSMQAPNYTPRTERLNVKEGDSFDWTLPPEFAVFSVADTVDTFEVFLDGKLLGRTPLKNRKLRPGKRRFELKSPCYKTLKQILTLGKGDVFTLDAAPKPLFAAVDVSAVDPFGKSIRGEIIVAGRNVGTAPGVFRVPVCSTDIAVNQMGYESYSQKLKLKPEQTLKIKAVMGVRQDMVTVPEGKYWYGCNRSKDSTCEPDEFPGKKHYRDSFRIDQTEVTVEAYRDCVKAGMCSPPGTAERCNWQQEGRNQHPVNCVDYFQALVFCSWKNKRLPYAHEFEIVARDSGGSSFAWGNKSATCQRANVGDCSSGTVPVKSYAKSGGRFGVYDLNGNVWEWIDSENTSQGNVRGGSFDFDSTLSRSTNKHRFPKSKSSPYVGFRCAKSGS
ncbi:MAG: SUMF1/EgtB/PvdO family nonheme iron enzyme [Myxococcota bacterium]|nr:SUMF1/EgtB/PvdO family nonheme iron enzyme [Myxococcota bacterium]